MEGWWSKGCGGGGGVRSNTRKSCSGRSTINGVKDIILYLHKHTHAEQEKKMRVRHKILNREHRNTHTQCDNVVCDVI